MRVIPSPLVRSILGTLDDTQYEKGRYAVLINPIKSCVDFYLKKANFHLEGRQSLHILMANNSKYIARSLRSSLFSHFTIYNTKHG